MKVAIPVFSGRVSPRLECAGEVLVAEVDAGEIRERRTHSLMGVPPPERFRLLLSLEVDALVCGGISGFLARQLQASGIRIFANVMGDVGFVLQLLAQGKLTGGWKEHLGRRRFRGGRSSRFGGIR